MRTIITCLFLLVSFHLLAQTGKITGKVISSKTGEPLIGATITVSGTSKASATDLNGIYTIRGLNPGTYTVSSSFISYAKKEVTEVVVTAGTVATLNITLDEANTATDSTGVVVRTVRRTAENVGALLAAQKNSASMSDGISAELIRRTPDRNTSEVLRRVSGASIQDDRFAIIRGLNDRYNAAFLNGAPLPSSESDRKAFAFNIFPSNILDNLVIYKTATPDMPAEFGGGIINITTKSIPSENFTTVSASIGYNTITTFKDRYEYKGGKYDFLGFDDGTRGVPKDVKGVDLQTISNDTRANLAKKFANNWGLEQKTFSPNFNFQVTKGLNIQRKDKNFLGVLLSLTYNKTSVFSEGERNSFEFDRTSSSALPVQRSAFIDKTYIESVLMGALANFSLKLSDKSTLAFKNILSINGDDRIIRRNGLQDRDNNDQFSKSDAQWFTSNLIYSSQLSGDHILTKKNLRLNWQGAYASVNRSIPNLRQSNYSTASGGTDYFATVATGRNALTNESGGSMFFSETKEHISSGKIDLTQPFTFAGNMQNQFKLGGYYQSRTRDFDAYLYGLGVLNSNNFDNSLLTLPSDKIFSPNNIGTLANGKQGFSLLEYKRPSYIYDASSKLSSAYAMLDQRFGKQFRAIYGIRLENYNQKLNSIDEASKPVNVNTTKLDWLPSVNLVYSLNTKQNIRASASKTLNRPEFRELAPFVFYDFVSRYTIEGDSSLVRASINNYDLRYEIYPGRAQLFSVTGFYKDFTNPIELVSSPSLDRQAIYQNARKAKIYGVEIEFRSLLSTLLASKNTENILNKITWSANASFIKSEITLGDFGGLISAKDLIEKRSLQGQSPYVVNTSFNYANDETGLSATLTGNRVGQRIYIVGTVSDADIYENGRTVVDFQLGKTFNKAKWEFRLTAKDILAQKQVFFFDLDDNRKYNSADGIFASYNFGPTISLNATYKF